MAETPCDAAPEIAAPTSAEAPRLRPVTTIRLFNCDSEKVA
jgi:hypothetical protein